MESRSLDPSGASLLEGLTAAQARAVVHRGGPLLIIAGAGSGKTRVLTRRIAHLLATGDARPFEILAITFTNKAADEMRARITELVGPSAKRMLVATFHAACLQLLRPSASRLGYASSFSVYDALDSRRLIEQILKELGIDLKKLPVRSVAARISGAKAELLGPDAYRARVSDAINPLHRRIADVYDEYQRRLLAANAMDFDDLLMQTVILFRTQPDVLAAYQERFRYILVDEYQDTNLAQNELILMLGAAHREVCVVGDADQSIYKFRAADIRNILDFEKTFPDATTILLEENFRSTKVILEAANAVIDHNVGRPPKTLRATGDEGSPILRYRAEDERDEARWVASEIDRLVSTEPIDYGEIAILYRANSQSRSIEIALEDAGIPYRVVGGTRFYDRREVKDTLAYLRLVANEADEISARRIVNVPRRGIGAKSLEMISSFARDQGLSFAQAFGHAKEIGLSGRAAREITDLNALLVDLRGQIDVLSPRDIIELVLELTGYRAELKAEETDEAQSRLENLAELGGAAAEYETLDDFLATMALVGDSDDVDYATTRVSMMTLHIAKGLEFTAVFLVGLEEGVFPHSRSLDEPEDLEEERRLAYVGITRARRHLAVSHAWVRNLWGQTTQSIPSRFVSEIPASLVTDLGTTLSPRSRERSSWSSNAARDEAPWEPARRRLDDADAPGGAVFGQGASRRIDAPTTTGGHLLGLGPGDEVLHERWGPGRVLSVSGDGDRATAVVRFTSTGDKTLMLSMAPLTRA